MSQTINLNADLGESFGAYTIGNDAALMAIVASANVACGFHAGDPLVLRDTVRAAKAAGVSIGAHPGFPDLQGFGRRPMQMSGAEVEAMIAYQIGALMGVAAAEGMTVTHVKPHGALNNMAAVDDDLSDAIARAIKAVDPNLIFLAPATSAMAAAGDRRGLPVACEIFADRAYGDDGQLLSRKLPGAMIHDPDESLGQILRFIEAGGLVTRSGKLLASPIHSICVHGDGPKSLAISGAVRQGLATAGLTIKPLPDVL